MKNLFASKLLMTAMSLTLFGFAAQESSAGGAGTGGGQDTVVAFNSNVLTLVKWLEDNGQNLTPPISAQEFFLAADPKYVIPINDSNSTSNTSDFRAVTKNCDGKIPTDPSDLRTACYNGVTKRIYLSESRYPANEPGSPAILGITAHEVFRKMTINGKHFEGDAYEVSKQISIASVPGSAASHCKDFYPTYGGVNYLAISGEEYATATDWLNNWVLPRANEICFSNGCRVANLPLTENVWSYNPAYAAEYGPASGTSHVEAVYPYRHEGTVQDAINDTSPRQPRIPRGGSGFQMYDKVYPLSYFTHVVCD